MSVSLIIKTFLIVESQSEPPIMLMFPWRSQLCQRSSVVSARSHKALHDTIESRGSNFCKHEPVFKPTFLKSKEDLGGALPKLVCTV